MMGLVCGGAVIMFFLISISWTEIKLFAAQKSIYWVRYAVAANTLECEIAFCFFGMIASRALVPVLFHISIVL